MSADPHFPLDEQFVLEVRGHSMNAAKPYPILPGAHIRCLRYGVGADIQSGDIAVVIQLRKDARCATTLRRIVRVEQGLELRPESSDVFFQPIKAWDPGQDVATVHIHARVEQISYDPRR